MRTAKIATSTSIVSQYAPPCPLSNGGKGDEATAEAIIGGGRRTREEEPARASRARQPDVGLLLGGNRRRLDRGARSRVGALLRVRLLPHLRLPELLEIVAAQDRRDFVAAERLVLEQRLRDRVE